MASAHANKSPYTKDQLERFLKQWDEAAMKRPPYVPPRRRGGALSE